jgi:hypothetical protein
MDQDHNGVVMHEVPVPMVTLVATVVSAATCHMMCANIVLALCHDP